MIGAGVMAQAMNSKMMRGDLLDAASQKLQNIAGGTMDAETAKKVGKEFESLFVSQMLEHMMSGDSMGDSLFGDAESDEIYKSMMVEQYSKAIVKSGGIGIAKYIEQGLAQRALLATQEVSS